MFSGVRTGININSPSSISDNLKGNHRTTASGSKILFTATQILLHRIGKSENRNDFQSHRRCKAKSGKDCRKFGIKIGPIDFSQYGYFSDYRSKFHGGLFVGWDFQHLC
jgi:hypothetical protein